MNRDLLAPAVAAVVALAVPAAAAAADNAVPAALARAVDAPTRSPRFVARDGARHPAAELAFFGVTPTDTVVEIFPGGGYWTQILAPLLHDHGTYDLAFGAPDGTHLDREFAIKPAFRAMLASDPAIYGRVHLTTLGDPGGAPIAPPGSADVVLTFRNLHNWMKEGDAPAVLARFRRALKPGGILGVEDHRANARSAPDPTAASGYVRQDYAIALIEKAGFRLVGTSEIDANPRDTADWPDGVWTLPPTLARGAVDRAKYEAIGEADNFVLKFRKPRD